MSGNHQPQALAPFSCTYSSHVPELLQKLNCSLAISTYQAGKLVFISALNESKIVQLPRTFDKPMGIAQDHQNDKLALACKDEVIVFSNAKELAKYYPRSPEKYDALYMPRVSYHTGNLDIHDLNFGQNNELYGVNTLFSSIVKIDDNYSFTPIWKPKFIDRVVSEDRCHLNGMAMLNGKPKYVTAFGKGNTFQSWRDTVTTGGIVIDVETDEIIIDGLAMPHTPRIFNGELYTLLSATGELIKINKEKSTYEVIVQLDGFVRGMDLYNDYLFIGLSKLRENSSTFAKLNLKANEAGIMIVHLPTASIAGKISYQTSLDEIYDVHVLPGKVRPNILNTIRPDYKEGVTTPDATYWAIKK
ncbi:MAG: TIGR03032 family protein [Crocinitomicaceae bacterium]|jgi:uncharacterized protein (TIGR03032 family)|tara:strand:- start:6870 stop:7946 length:1077 start_codon:yes stop_codon:yes gene_type:complete